MATVSDLESNLSLLNTSNIRLSPEIVQYLWDNGVDVDALKSHAVLRPQAVDLSHPLTSYFISSSHNTYLLSRQLLGKSSAEAYNQVISKGARCVEFDVWSLSSRSSTFNAESTGPKGDSGLVVTHGFTFSQAVSLESVVSAVKVAMEAEEAKNGGSPAWPVFISLECHVPVDEQQKIVDLMKSSWGDRLVAAPLRGDNPPPLSAFMGKILVMVEYYPPDQENVDVDSSDVTDSQDEGEGQKPRKKPPHPKIIDSLASIGHYARSMKPREGWYQQQFNEPANILINISEPGLAALLPGSLDHLITHANSHLRRVFPKGTRVQSSNLDPRAFWRTGSQVVSLNWQKFDRGMHLNEAMFAGSNGWVLKPSILLPNGATQTTSQRQKKLEIEFLGISDCYPPDDLTKNGDSFHAYIVAQFFPPSAEPTKLKTKSIKTKTLAHSAADIWFSKPQVLEFTYNSEEEALSFLRLRIKEDEFGKDDILAIFCARVDLLDSDVDGKTKGWRLIRMLDGKGNWKGATVLARFKISDASTP